MTSLPRLRACSACPLRRPSPAATISTMETMPQAIPNIVKNARNLWDHKVRITSSKRSRRVITRELDGPMGRKSCPWWPGEDTDSARVLLQKFEKRHGSLRFGGEQPRRPFLRNALFHLGWDRPGAVQGFISSQTRIQPARSK